MNTTRTVTVYPTVGRNRVTLDYDGQTWGPLSQQLQALDIPVNSQTAIVAETQFTLQSADALLPVTNFTLMIFPRKVDSGNEPDEIVPDDIFEDVAPCLEDEPPTPDQHPAAYLALRGELIAIVAAVRHAASLLDQLVSEPVSQQGEALPSTVH